jgi:hypothetical protein
MTNLIRNYVVQNLYYYNPLHVSRNTVLIIMKTNCINIASGIVVEVEKELLLNLHTGRSLTDSTIPVAVLTQFDLLMMSKVLLETCRGLQE